MKPIIYSTGQPVELGHNYSVQGSPDRHARLEDLAFQVVSSGGRAVWIDPAGDPDRASSALRELGDEAKNRREALKRGETDLPALVAVVDHTKRLDAKEVKTLVSLARSASKLGMTLLVTDSPGSMPAELAGMFSETLTA